ncbi:MAG: hypothetical protein QXP77_01505 [Candidatus Aenigmatarchaeota archaeon]
MIEYITTRTLENLKGEAKGKVRILKLKGEENGKVEFKCPECGYEGSWEERWEEPFLQGSGINQKFNLKCKSCNFSIKISKLKKEIKKKNA